MAQREVTESEVLMAMRLGGLAIRAGSEYWWVEALGDGRKLWLMPTFSCVRLGVSEPGDDTGFSCVYDYADHHAGFRAVLGWDGQGDPEGWVRAWAAGGIPRRRPDGTPASEYVAP